jgi:hypothetical protein
MLEPNYFNFLNGFTVLRSPFVFPLNLSSPRGGSLEEMYIPIVGKFGN